MKRLRSINFKYLFAAPLIVFLMVFVIYPMLILVWNAFQTPDGFGFSNFMVFFRDGFSMPVFLRSLWVAAVCAVVSVFIAYPIAYALAISGIKRAPTILMLFILPMWINTLLRTFAMREFFFLFDIGLGYTTMIIGIVVDFLPFMILPIYIVLGNIGTKYIEASQDLGAPPFKVFTKTVLPLSVPGILSGFLLVFTPTISTFFLSFYLGNSDTPMFGEVLNRYFIHMIGGEGPGSALSLILLLVVGITLLVTNRFTKIGNKRGGLW